MNPYCDRIIFARNTKIKLIKLGHSVSSAPLFACISWTLLNLSFNSYFFQSLRTNFELLLTKMRISKLTEISCFHHCLQINNLGGNGTALTSACSPPATSTSAVTRQIKVSTLFFIEIDFRAKLQMLLMIFVILPLCETKT